MGAIGRIHNGSSKRPIVAIRNNQFGFLPDSTIAEQLFCTRSQLDLSGNYFDFNYTLESQPTVGFVMYSQWSTGTADHNICTAAPPAAERSANSKIQTIYEAAQASNFLDYGTLAP